MAISCVIFSLIFYDANLYTFAETSLTTSTSSAVLYSHFLCLNSFKFLILLCMIVCLMRYLFPYIVYGYIQPLNHSLKYGDWHTLICYLNCINKVKPGNRPILIIREIINFERKVLQETLKAMEKYKENRVIFPTIMETSDFLWFKAPGIRKSRLSYLPYVIKEMDFEEGKYELVTRLKMFTLEEYT